MAIDWDYDPMYNLSVTSNYDNNAYTYINEIINPISIFCGLCVIIITVGFHLYDRRLMNRVSLRLNATISAVDVVKSIALIFYNYIPVVDPNSPACAFESWFLIFTTNYYMFLTMMISVNLQYVFLNKGQYHDKREYWYFGISLGLALLTTLPAYIAGEYGYDPTVGYCWWIHYSTLRTNVWEWCTFLIWNLAGITYCIVIAIMVTSRLGRTVWALNAMNSVQPAGDKPLPSDAERRRRDTQAKLYRLVTRIILYTLIPILTQGGFVLIELWLRFAHNLSDGIDYWAVIGTDIAGMLNFLAFLVDPATQTAFQQLRSDLVTKYGTLPQSSVDPQAFGSEGNASDSKFMRWIVRSFISSKKSSAGSPFYPMTRSAEKSERIPQKSDKVGLPSLPPATQWQSVQLELNQVDGAESQLGTEAEEAEAEEYNSFVKSL